MKPRSDEVLQQLLDQWDQSALPDHPDTNAYQRLYEGLEQPPAFHLSENFADRVVDQTLRIHQRRNYRQSAFLVALIMLSLLLSAVAIYYTDVIFFRTLTQLVLQTKEIIVFTVAAFLLVQLGDRWIVKKAR